MAREIQITVVSATNFVEVFDGQVSPAVLNNSFLTGLGAWWGEYEGQYQQRLVLKFAGGQTGSFEFTEVQQAIVDGVDVKAASSDLQELLAYIGPTMFA